MSPNALVLRGWATASRHGQIGAVETTLMPCNVGTQPGDPGCEIFRYFSRAILRAPNGSAQPIVLTEGQQILVTVVISFS